MIDILEIKNTDRVTVGVVDVANSIIWRSVYNGVGDFEIYIKLTPENIALLQKDYYVTRPNNDEIGIIENIAITFNMTNGYMMSVSGRFAKSLLDRRIIYKLSGTVNTPTILSGNVEIAVRQTILDNAIDCGFDSRRNMSILGLAALNNLTPIIVDENGNPAQKQVSYQNLLSYTDEVLKEYGLSSKIIFNNSNKKLLYSVFQGTDRSVDNESGNAPIIFSVDYDNLNSSNYSYSETALKNSALIGGAGQDLERFYTLLTQGKTGLALREMFVDASTINRTYKDAQDQEQQYTNAQYREMLNQKAQQEFKQHIISESFTGEVNATFGSWIYGRDYFLGDIVTVQDNNIGKYANVRISEVAEVQDENGYTLNIVFGE